MEASTAKLFASGGSQAVRLPAEFRFEGRTEVYVRRDASTGDVILSTQSPVDWPAFMKIREQLGPVPEDFLSKREQAEESRDPFDGWQE